MVTLYDATIATEWATPICVRYVEDQSRFGGPAATRLGRDNSSTTAAPNRDIGVTLLPLLDCSLNLLSAHHERSH